MNEEELDENEKEPGLFEARSGLRTAAALGTEIFLNTLIDPVLEPGTQIAAGTAINWLAQRIRGGELSKGELAAAGLASLIPGGAQGRALTQVLKGGAKGAASGAIETLGMAGIDEGRLPTKEELAAGAGLGIAFGGALSTPGAIKALTPVKQKVTNKGFDLQNALKNIKNRLKGTPVQEIQEQIAQQTPQKNLGGYMDDEGIDIEDYGFGPEGPRGGATDEQIMQAYRERTGELDLDPRRRVVEGDGASSIPTARGFLGFAKRYNELHDYIEKAYQYRQNRLQQGGKANLMKGFDEVIQNDSGQDVILVKKRTLQNRQDAAAKENYVPRLKYDVEQDIVEKLGYEMKPDADIKFLQLIRRELNNIEQRDPKLYLTSLMEYGDAAYLEHKIARRRARKFWARVEGQRAEDIKNNLFQWTGATNRNTLKNLRLLFDPNYKKLKDVLEDRLIKLEKPLGLKSNGDPEGFVITIEDPLESVYSAKDLFVRSNPGNIEIRKAGTGEVVGIIPDFYRQLYSTQFKTAFNARKLALTGTDVPKNLRAQGQEPIDVYRKNVLDRMLTDIVTGKTPMLGREEAYLDELGEFYNFFTRLEDETNTQWVRKPRWVNDILTGKNKFLDKMEADAEDFNVRDQTKPARVVTREEELARIRRDELADLLKNMPREQGGKFKGRYFTSKRKAVAEIRKEIQELEAEFDIGNYLEGTDIIQEKLF